MIRPSLLRTALAGAALALLALPAAAQRIVTETAIFAGGCFWCTEVDFDKVDGVISTTSGYIGGKQDNPTYRDVTSGRSGHTEAVQIEFDPSKVTYQQLVEIFWRTIDPLDAGGQFCDRGDSYRSGIFTRDEAQAKIAKASKAALSDSKRFKQPIVTEITAGQTFWKAEAYHQDFYKKDPGRYYSYRAGCGRDARVKALWGAEAGGKVPTQ
jgi:peptide-methionine (S)-S-oxide reductase